MLKRQDISRTLFVKVITRTVTGIHMGLFTTSWYQAVCYLTGVQCFWSEETLGRAQCMPNKMQLVLQSPCGSSLVQRECHLDRTLLQCTHGPGKRTKHYNGYAFCNVKD